MQDHEKHKRPKKSRVRMRSVDLNLILWLAFLLFAVLLIVMCTLVQNYVLGKRYREQISKSLREAAQSLQQRLGEGNSLSPTEASKLLLSVTNEYNVSIYLFSADGEVVFPDIPE